MGCQILKSIHDGGISHCELEAFTQGSTFRHADHYRFHKDLTLDYEIREIWMRLCLPYDVNVVK